MSVEIFTADSPYVLHCAANVMMLVALRNIEGFGVRDKTKLPQTNKNHSCMTFFTSFF